VKIVRMQVSSAEALVIGGFLIIVMAHVNVCNVYMLGVNRRGKCYFFLSFQLWKIIIFF
jgi:hypothetical protein